MPDSGALDLSLTRGDVAWRLQRRLHLIPERGMGVGRRALLFATLTWLPLAIAARVAESRGITPSEPLQAHFSVHVRCLVAIPLMILAEGVGDRQLPRVLAQFELAGIVRSTDRERFHALLAGISRLRDRVLPWVLIAGLVLAWATTAILRGEVGEIDWMADGEAGTQEPGFGAWWFALVVRPIFMALLLAWLWRTLLVLIMMQRLSRFPLFIVPAHPDRRGGLGFIERLALVFSPVALAISAVAASTFAHDVVYHGVNVVDIKLELAGTAILVTLLFLAPFMPLSRLLFHSKREAMPAYGALLARHGRLVYRRWILDEQIEPDPILCAHELGPCADIQTMYQAVEAMHVRCIDKLGILAIALPAILPVLVVAMIQIPVGEILGRVLKAVM